MDSSKACPPEFLRAKDDRGTIDTGDSGDELGDGSVIDEESTVETVVVGEESVESDVEVEVDAEVDVDVLPRCWY